MKEQSVGGAVRTHNICQLYSLFNMSMVHVAPPQNYNNVQDVPSEITDHRSPQQMKYNEKV